MMRVARIGYAADGEQSSISKSRIEIKTTIRFMNMKTRTPTPVALGFIGAVSLFSFFCVANSFADGKQDFTLHNQTGKAIKEIYVGPSNSDGFGEDVMGKDVVRNGASVHVTFHSSAPGNRWDLRIVFDDNTSTSWTNFNLSTIDEITISYRDGKPLATWK